MPWNPCAELCLILATIYLFTSIANPMIKHGFILNHVDDSLNHALKPIHLSETLTLKPAEEWILEVERECQAAVKALKGIRYELSETELIRHIQLNYIDVILLIELLRHYAHSFTAVEAHVVLKGFYLSLIRTLEVVQHHLEGMSEHFYEPSQRIPNHQFRIYLEELRLENLVLKSKYKGKKIDADLQALVTNYFENFLLLKTSTYQQLQYAKALISGLIKSMSISAEGDLTNLLISRLIVLNFNSPLYYSFCKQRLTHAMSRETDLKTQISTLQYFSKELQTCIQITKSALDPNAETIKQSLLHLLDAEIRYRESQVSSARLVPVQPIQVANASREKAMSATGVKLKVNSSVHQMAVAIGILVKIDVLIPDKFGMKGVFGFFARNVSTIGAETISIISMQKRATERDASACESLLHILERMIVILKRDFLT
jgi:hypothetical protein